MIPLPRQTMAQCFANTGLVKIQAEERQKRLFSRGDLRVFQGERLEKLAALTVKGLHLYHYDYGIAYPDEAFSYPLFLYQIIIVPKRVLAVVHYPYYQKEQLSLVPGIPALLEQEAGFEELLLKPFLPQAFIRDQIFHNQFNGLVRTQDMERAYEAVVRLWQTWYAGLLLQAQGTAPAVLQEQQQWNHNFMSGFYQQDYGYTATKRYLGEAWARKAFEGPLRPSPATD